MPQALQTATARVYIFFKYRRRHSHDFCGLAPDFVILKLRLSNAFLAL